MNDGFDVNEGLEAVNSGRLSRKAFLTRGAAAGVSTSVLATLLAACGGGSNNSGKNGTPATSAVSGKLAGDGSLARVYKDGLKIGSSDDPPYNFHQGGKLVGIDAELMQEAVKRMGISKVTYSFGVWDGLVPALQAKRFDVLQTDLHVTPERSQVIDFTGPLFWYGDGLVVPKGNPKNLHTFEGLAGHTVGALSGESYLDWLKQRHDLKGVKTYKTFNDEIQDLLAGRVDALIGETDVVGYYLSQHPDAKLELASGYRPKTDFGDWTRWGVQKGANDLANALTRVADEMRVDGTMWKILSKYGLPLESLQIFRGMPRTG